MIISKEVKITVNNNRISFYKEIGYINIKQGDSIILPIEFLSLGSLCLVEVECDFCKTKLNRRYSEYLRNIKINNKFCCKKCAPIEYRKNCLEKYGVDNTSKLSETHIKIKKTCLEKHGNEKYRNVEQRQQTKLEKYKGDYSSIVEKSKISCLKKYGVENASQCSKVFSKQQKSRYEIHQYKDTDLFYQGTYEKDFLDKYYNKFEIIKIEPIDYIYEEKNKKYFSDFYLPELNLIVEIKSSYTYEKYKDQNLKKRQTCINIGYNFLFIIDKNYSDFEEFV